ncbi:MAG TPA: glycoside hydrolase family protein, partial [Polyangiaceae bacterium]
MSDTGSSIRRTLGATILLVGMALPELAGAKPLSAYFRPIPSACPLTSNTWGDKGVLPRDICNGMEDPTGTPTTRGQWMYWDGKILRGQDGRYHMFADRWAHTAGMNGWYNSETIHAVSPALLGKYEDKGFAFNDGPNAQAPHKGHNVTASELPDGTYVLIVNEIVPFTIFTATSLDGPWKNRGHAVIDKNGVPLTIPSPGDQNLESNVSFTVRHDGNFEIVQRHGIIAISTAGLLGPYKVQAPTTTYSTAEAVPASLASIYPNRKKHLSAQAPTTVESTYVYAEDPLIWYSGGQYHVIYNYPDDRVAYHLTSPDGIHGWVDQGLAFDPRDSQQLFSNSDGTINHWYNIERPNVILENGHIT